MEFTLTELHDLKGYEVSLVPMGANNKRRFLVTKEHGELSMDKKLLEKILKEGPKNMEEMEKVAKNLGMNEDETSAFKAVMKIVGSDSSPLGKEKLMKALGSMNVKKEEPPKKDKKDETDDPVGKGDYKTDDKKPVDKEGEPPATNGGNAMKGVPVQKSDGSWDLSGVDENMRPALEVICKSNEELAKSLGEQVNKNKSLAEKLKIEEEARVSKEMIEKAEEMGHAGDEAAKVAEILKAAYGISKENGQQLEAVLKSQAEKVNSSAMFTEVGKSGGSETRPGAGAWGKIEKQAEAFVKADPKISQADAIDLVLKRHPELYEEYELEKRRAV